MKIKQSIRTITDRVTGQSRKTGYRILESVISGLNASIWEDDLLEQAHSIVVVQSQIDSLLALNSFPADIMHNLKTLQSIAVYLKNTYHLERIHFKRGAFKKEDRAEYEEELAALDSARQAALTNADLRVGLKALADVKERTRAAFQRFGGEPLISQYVETAESVRMLAGFVAFAENKEAADAQ